MTEDDKTNPNDEPPADELWKKISSEVEMLRSRTTPAYMKQRIMDALPEEPPEPWYKRIFKRG